VAQLIGASGCVPTPERSPRSPRSASPHDARWPSPCRRRRQPGALASPPRGVASPLALTVVSRPPRRVRGAGNRPRRALCACRRHPHRTLVSISRPRCVQARARDARYALMAAACEAAGVAYLLTPIPGRSGRNVLMRLAAPRGQRASPASGPFVRSHRRHSRSACARWPVPISERAADRCGRPSTILRTATAASRARRARELLARERCSILPHRCRCCPCREAEAALAWAAERAWASRSVASAERMDARPARASAGAAAAPRGTPFRGGGPHARAGRMCSV
jgi:hypothetical protein